MTWGKLKTQNKLKMNFSQRWFLLFKVADSLFLISLVWVKHCDWALLTTESGRCTGRQEFDFFRLHHPIAAAPTLASNAISARFQSLHQGRIGVTTTLPWSCVTQAELGYCERDFLQMVLSSASWVEEKKCAGCIKFCTTNLSHFTLKLLQCFSFKRTQGLTESFLGVVKALLISHYFGRTCDVKATDHQ